MTSDNNKPNSIQYVHVSIEQAGQRIDNFLLSLIKGVPKSRIYRAIRTGEVRINKCRIRPTYKVQEHDVVRVPPLRTTKKTTVPFVKNFIKQKLISNILLEDDDLLVLNKPNGLAVHAGSNVDQGIIETLRIIRSDLSYLELVHRLDRDTSGCLLLAKNRTALRSLQQQMIDNSIKKHYLVLLKSSWGKSEKLVDQPLLKKATTSNERAVHIHQDGKRAKTTFIPIECFAKAQLTEVLLHTGRMHQIRAHAAYINHPVAGDDKYGQYSFNRSMKTFGLKRLFLHAWKLLIYHPNNKQRLTLCAPLPLALQQVIDNLRQKP